MLVSREPTLASVITNTHEILGKTNVTLNVVGVFTKKCLIDLSSSESFIYSDIAEKLKLPIEKSDLQRDLVTMAAIDLSLNIEGVCGTTIKYCDHVNFLVRLEVID